MSSTGPDPLAEDPEVPREPDEPVDPDQKPVPEGDLTTPEDYHVADVDPEVPLTQGGDADPEELYPHAEDVEEDRA